MALEASWKLANIFTEERDCMEQMYKKTRYARIFLGSMRDASLKKIADKTSSAKLEMKGKLKALQRQKQFLIVSL